MTPAHLNELISSLLDIVVGMIHEFKGIETTERVVLISGGKPRKY